VTNAVLGPRQSGKTTLVRETFPDHKYLSLEDLDLRAYAATDPRGFLAEYQGKVIFDEIQNVPTLFSYLQTEIDKTNKPGQFILTGSQHFLLQENISQTLAGRVAILYLLPLAIEELKAAKIPINNLEELLFKGFYPRIYQQNLDAADWYPNYIQTYIEKDVRQMKNIQDLTTFQKFLKMCASRTGQLLNLSGLAADCGITHNTAKAWISLLQTSFIIFLLQPYFNNFGKRLVKTPKLYFYDTGLVSSLLGIEEEKQLTTHYLKGGIFESFVISELLKARYNRGKSANLYFWRDKTGHEIDCIIEEAQQLIPLEIKSAKTIVNDFFSGLDYWKQFTPYKTTKTYIIYGGDTNQTQRKQAIVLSWKNINEIY
jgi:predicted AAA+ superfamily ATPase